MSRRRGFYNGKDLLAMKPEEAACEGIFMAFQYPVEIPGISNAYFLAARSMRFASTAGRMNSTPWISCPCFARS